MRANGFELSGAARLNSLIFALLTASAAVIGYAAYT
jgi:hypothetical protein